VFLLAGSRAHAQSWSFQGTCYPDENAAFAAFTASFPYVLSTTNGFTVYNLYTSSNSVSATGLITFYITANYPSSGTRLVPFSMDYLQLQACNSQLFAELAVSQVAAVLSTAEILYSFSWGFGLIMFVFFFGYGIRTASKAIKSV
jgi:hypothetical protein